MDTIDERKVVIQSLDPAWYQHKVAALDMLRLDLVHPVVSGNKWYKLRLNVKHAIERNFKCLLTFGGGYSNHLAATAYTAKIHGIKSIAIVRGKYDVLTPTLEQCMGQGMELIFISQADYQKKHEPDWARELISHFDDVFIIPEGGANEWGREGAGLITRFINDSYTHVAVSVGTGTTFMGIRNSLNIGQQLIGFVPMKQGEYLKEHIAPLLHPDHNHNWQLFADWHFGGFGKWNQELLSFMNSFYASNAIPLDVVYTSKMMFGLQQMATSGFFSENDRILCIHSGGLQGNVSVAQHLHY